MWKPFPTYPARAVPQAWDKKNQTRFANTKHFGNAETVARNAVQWDALLPTFPHVFSMQILLPRFLKDARKLYSHSCIQYIHTLFFSASAFTLGSPTGVGADLT